MSETPVQFSCPPIGQERAASFLEKSLISGKLAQTYIFAGPRDLGKASLALAFARNLWRFDHGQKENDDNFENVNSDLYILEREADKKQISVDQAREFSKRLSLSSFLNSYKIGIIKEAELLSTEAQNALLKTLEEPRDKVVIILLVEDVSALMPTIASRSQILYFYPVSSAAVYDYLLASLEIKRSDTKEMSAAALGRPLQARQWAENPALYQEQSDLVKQLFNFLNTDLADRFSQINAAGTEGSLSADTARQWLDIWESLWRDALLLSLNQEDRLRYPALLPKWKQYLESWPESERAPKALVCLKQLQQARIYINGFVNPKNILESLAIYF